MQQRQQPEQQEESVLKLTCLLIKAIDRKINYKFLFFLLLAVFTAYYTNQFNVQSQRDNLAVLKSTVNDLVSNLNEEVSVKVDATTSEPPVVRVEDDIVTEGKEELPVEIPSVTIGSAEAAEEKSVVDEVTKKKVVVKEIKVEDIPVKKEEQRPATTKPPPVMDKGIQNFQPVKISKIKPKKIWIPIPGSNGGHRRVPSIEVKAGKEHKSSVKVWLYEEFLTKEECDNLIKVHDERVQQMKNKKPIICFDSIKTLRKHLHDLRKGKTAEIVTPNDFIEGTKCINQTFSRQLEKWGLKWSFSTAFYPGESKFSKVFGRRIEEATMLNETHGGKFQITSYPLDVGYKSHTDCVIDGSDERDRYATFLVYLNDFVGDEGGETNFTKVGIDVKPKTGRALTWNSMNYETGKCEEASLHEANKVKTVSQKKYIIQRWYYYKNFYSLGKRTQEPEIPERDEYTPRVSCDEYDYGSCRMYDEWNYDHLLEYMNRKHTLSY